MPRVLLSGDRLLIRTALNALLSSMSEMTVVGECPNTPDALATAVSGARPSVIVMDYEFDGRAPDELAALLRAANGCPVLIVTAREDAQGISSAIRNGALGVVLKYRPAEVLLRAITAVAAGQTWLERSMVANLFQPPRADRTSAPRDKLTRREAEIVELIRLGLQNKKIAERLCISETTVRHHLTSIYGKLAVANRLELMRYAYGDGLPAAC